LVDWPKVLKAELMVDCPQDEVMSIPPSLRLADWLNDSFDSWKSFPTCPQAKVEEVTSEEEEEIEDIEEQTDVWIEGGFMNV
jgi:hypothetical protein